MICKELYKDVGTKIGVVKYRRAVSYGGDKYYELYTNSWVGIGDMYVNDYFGNIEHLILAIHKHLGMEDKSVDVFNKLAEEMSIVQNAIDTLKDNFNEKDYGNFSDFITYETEELYKYSKMYDALSIYVSGLLNHTDKENKRFLNAHLKRLERNLLNAHIFGGSTNPISHLTDVWYAEVESWLYIKLKNAMEYFD